MNDLQLDPARLIERLGDEIGILSVKTVELTLQLNGVLSLLSQEQSAAANLRLAVIAKDSDIKDMREQMQTRATQKRK